VAIFKLPSRDLVARVSWLTQELSRQEEWLRVPPQAQPAVTSATEPRVCCWSCTYFQVTGWLDRTVGLCAKQGRRTLADKVCDDYARTVRPAP
jgi:hypothetical protein